jgi:hypothetical protein
VEGRTKKKKKKKRTHEAIINFKTHLSLFQRTGTNACSIFFCMTTHHHIIIRQSHDHEDRQRERRTEHRQLFTIPLHNNNNNNMTIIMLLLLLWMCVACCCAFTPSMDTRTFRSSSVLATTRNQVDTTFVSTPPFVEQPQTPKERTDHLMSTARRETSSDFDTLAVVLNTNARGVTQHLVDAAIDVAAEHTCVSPKIQIHVTSTLEQATQAASDIIAHARRSNKQTLVVPVGGDGTLTTMIDQLWQAHLHCNGDETTPLSKEFPVAFAYVPMGTGNALGSVVACQAQQPKKGKKRRWLKRLLTPVTAKNEHFRQTLRQLLAGISNTNHRVQTDTVALPLMQVQTFASASAAASQTQPTPPNIDYTFFAGVGFDSLMLQDYKDMQEWSHQKVKNSRVASLYRFLKDTVLGGVTGYTVALFTRTLPQCIERNAHLMQVRVSTFHPNETYWIDHRRGDLMRPVTENDDQDDRSTLLYQGKAGIVAAGTAPFYGGAMRLFPFARMTPSGMHLRVGRIHPLKGVVNIPAIFEGSYRDNSEDQFGCLDFCGSHFVIDILTPHDGYPVQHSGESVGKCTRVQFAVAGGHGDTDDNDALPLPPSMRFVTLMPPRLIVEEDKESAR